MTHLAQMLLGFDIQPDRQLGMLLGITLLVEMNHSVMPVLYLQAQIFHNLGAQPPPRSHQKRLVLRTESQARCGAIRGFHYLHFPHSCQISFLPLTQHGSSSFLVARFLGGFLSYQLLARSSLLVARQLVVRLLQRSRREDDMTIVFVLFIVFPYEWNRSFFIQNTGFRRIVPILHRSVGQNSTLSQKHGVY